MAEVVTNDGVRIHYVERGTGRPLLLLGGSSMSTPFYRKQLDGLSDAYRVIAMDMRGYGESEKPPHGHRLSRHARDVYDLCVALDLDDVTAIGWSSGANALLAYWELFQDERIKRLVHVEQTPWCLNRDGWELGFGTSEDAAAFLDAQRDDPVGSAQGLVEIMPAQPFAEEEASWMVEEILKTPNPAALQLSWDHLNADWRDVVPTVGVPVLVVTGRKSQVFPWESGRWLAAHFPNAEHAIFEESGHMPFYEEPERFNGLIRTFVG